MSEAAPVNPRDEALKVLESESAIERWIREVWDSASSHVKAAFADKVIAEATTVSHAGYYAFTQAIGNAVSKIAAEIVAEQEPEIRMAIHGDVMARVTAENIECEVNRITRELVQRVIRDAPFQKEGK